MSSPTTASSVIHDIGYRRYTGPRLGRGYATRSLYVHGLRTAFGLGRSAAAKFFPWGIFGLLVAVAAILVAVQSQVSVLQQRVFEYWQFPTQINVLVLLYCAVAAPELVSRDLRGGVLPLYFSRPLTRLDYPLAKWAALVSAVFLLLLGPELVLFLGTAFSNQSMSAVWDEFGLFGEGLVVSALTAVLFASLALLVSSLAGNRAVAAALTVGLFILTTPVLGVLQGIAHAGYGPDGGMTADGERLSQLSFLVSPFTIVQGIGAWLFGGQGQSFIGPYGPLYLVVTLAVVAASLLLLLLRYRKVAR
jgi:ABC-2 type transport system permease protein